MLSITFYLGQPEELRCTLRPGAIKKYEASLEMIRTREYGSQGRRSGVICATPRVHLAVGLAFLLSVQSGLSMHACCEEEHCKPDDRA